MMDTKNFRRITSSAVSKMTDAEYKKDLKLFSDYAQKCFDDLKTARAELGNNHPSIDDLAAKARQAQKDFEVFKKARD